jgi:hypothetical protein
MYPERLFTMVGTRFSPSIALEIGQTDEAEEYHEIIKNKLQHYIKMLKKMQVQEALLDLLELEYEVQPLAQDDRFAALVALTATACRRYVLANLYEDRACKLEPQWELFTEMSDDVYESGSFFLADQLRVKIKNLDPTAPVSSVLLTVEPTLQHQLGHICQLENPELWGDFSAGNTPIKPADKMTNDELIVQLCDEILLPFYARLELLNIAETKNMA